MILSNRFIIPSIILMLPKGKGRDEVSTFTYRAFSFVTSVARQLF
jgi:hypothetical protein